MNLLNKKPYDLFVFDLHGTLAPTQNTFFPGVIELLKQLKSGGYLIGAASNWGAHTINHLLKQLPPDFSFDAIRNASTCLCKPHPQMLLEILNELTIPPARALMIGDTTIDIEFARNAQVDALAVSYSGSSPKDDLIKQWPIDCLDSLNALKEWFASHG